MKVYCKTETGILKAVIIGYPNNFHNNNSIIEVVNQTQEKFYADPSVKPCVPKLIPEFANFQEILEKNDIKVCVPQSCEVPDQLTPRDIGFVVGDTFFIAEMAKKSRKSEFNGIVHIIKQFDNGTKVIKVPNDIVIEGGDIIVDGNLVFVGLSQRTTKGGYNFLVNQLPDFQVIPVFLKSLKEGEDCLHLDCVFVPVGKSHALIYPQGIKKIPDEMRLYDWLEINREEQEQLGTNVLSLSPKTVISRHNANRINSELKQIVKVIELNFDEAPKTGGSFRCCSLPLLRV